MRLKAFKLLPEAADADVAWAVDQCVTRESMTISAAFAELQRRLAAKGISSPAFSSFHRLIQELRDTGVPPRYRLQKAAAAAELPAGLLAALTELVDQRIEHALQRREGRS